MIQKPSSALRLNAQLKFGAYLSRSRAIGPRTLPKLLRHPKRLDIELLPPREFITALVLLAMVSAT